MQEHAGKWPPRALLAVRRAPGCFFDQPGRLEAQLDIQL
jgi:hypothetical protein